MRSVTATATSRSTSRKNSIASIPGTTMTIFAARTVALSFALALGCLPGMALGQTLEDNYARLCSDADQADEATCAALRKALLDKLQAAEAATPHRAAATGVQTSAQATPAEADPALVAEWRLRWGPFADMVGKRWITSVAGQSLDIAKAIAGAGTSAVYEWEVPGEVMAVYQYTGSERTLSSRIRWDQTTGGLIEESTAMPGYDTHYIVELDGSLSYTISNMPDAAGTYRRLSGNSVELRLERELPTGKVVLSYVYRELTREALAERQMDVQNLVEAEAQARQDAARRQQQAEQDRANRWSAVMGAVNGALDAGLEVARAQEAQSRYELDSTLADINAQARAQQAAQTQASAMRSGTGYTAAPAASPVSAPQASTTYTPVQGPGTGSWASAGQGSSGGADSPAASGSASTRDDASMCVSPPITSTHKCADLSGYKAMVSNTCAVPVDVRVCFMTDGGWNCQSNYGLAPEATWEPGWCHANTGEVFHAVRYSDSKEPLASP